MKGLAKAKDFWHAEASDYEQAAVCKVGDGSVENCATRKKYICSKRSMLCYSQTL